MEKKKPKRLLIDIEETTHAEVKAQAAKRRITIKLWVTRAIQEALKLEYR